MADKQMSLDLESKKSGPVECLGMTFESDEARRAYFLERLKEKLEDPEFRKIPGFPLGTDEEILRLSDPPYYTACPNPFWSDIVRSSAERQDSRAIVSPLDLGDVAETKADALYRLPSYHTKVPYKAIIRFLLHYTSPGDVVLDAFGGSGMTGVASLLAANSQILRSMGFSVLDDGTVTGADGQIIGKAGLRIALVSDLSPFATFTASLVNSPPPSSLFDTGPESLSSFLSRVIEPAYQTTIDGVKESFDYAIWTDWATCANCGDSHPLFDHIIAWDDGVLRKSFRCPTCGLDITVQGVERTFANSYDPWTNEPVHMTKTTLALLSRRVGIRAVRSVARPADVELAESVGGRSVHIKPMPLPYMHMTHERNNLPKYWGITHIHQFYTRRNYWALDQIVEYCKRVGDRAGLWATLSVLDNNLTRRNRFYVDQRRPQGSPIGPLSNTLYVPQLQVEANVAKKITDAFEDMRRVATDRQGLWPRHHAFMSTQSATELRQLPDNVVDFIFTDPPFGGNINYSDQNYLAEWWLQVFTDTGPEAITNPAQRKGIDEYESLMTQVFREYYRVLKPGRWMVVEFHNSSNAVWISIQRAIRHSGFFITGVNILDKKQYTMHQDHKGGTVNKDLLIITYKPADNADMTVGQMSDQEGAVWRWVYSHLRQLPVWYERPKGVPTLNPERTEQVLFDRMVGYFLQTGRDVPVKASDFFAGLAQRFSERDGMYFLHEQTALYDKFRAETERLTQPTLTITDEQDAIRWLRFLLGSKPQPFKEIQPLYMMETQKSWASHEAQLELRELLEENFLHFDGIGLVPAQIHTYLSTNFKDMRGLAKDDPGLRAKAANRWYVPDPNKQGDLDQLRTKRLLKEFAEYKESKQKKLRQFRTEAIRAGFKAAYDQKDYRTIVEVAKKLPERVIQEDEKLLMYYDVASMRLGED